MENHKFNQNGLNYLKSLIVKKVLMGIRKR